MTIDGIWYPINSPWSRDTLLWTYRIPCGKGQCKWRTRCLPNLQSPTWRTGRPVWLLIIQCIFEPHIEHKNKDILPTPIIIPKYFRYWKAISKCGDGILNSTWPNTHWNRNFDTRTYFQIALARGQLIDVNYIPLKLCNTNSKSKAALRSNPPTMTLQINTLVLGIKGHCAFY